MKMTKIIAAAAALTLAGTAFAADPIVGNWHMIEDGQPKAVVKISQSGSTFTGVVTEGLTQKAKGYVNTPVIKGLKAQGGGKYGAGTITDPRNNKEYDMNATLSGNTLTIKGGYKIAGKVVGKTQVWKKAQ
ncbi:MAG: DUF2147 domain-containing protein [Moraxella sp.]|nr:DUF2147 domain-containing protein [Moraxella sp.]